MLAYGVFFSFAGDLRVDYFLTSRWGSRQGKFSLLFLSTCRVFSCARATRESIESFHHLRDVFKINVGCMQSTAPMEIYFASDFIGSNWSRMLSYNELKRAVLSSG